MRTQLLCDLTGGSIGKEPHPDHHTVTPSEWCRHEHLGLCKVGSIEFRDGTRNHGADADVREMLFGETSLDPTELSVGISRWLG